MSERLGLRAAARALGISHPALLKAVTTGRVTRGEDGRFDIDSCRVAMARNTHPIKSQSARAQQENSSFTTPDEIPVPPGDAPSDLLVGVAPLDPDHADVTLLPDQHSIAEATRQLEWARARREQIRAAREEGKLVELEPVNAFVAGMIIRARDEFARIPTELRDILAREADPLKIEATLRNRIDDVLIRLSEFKRAA